MYYQQNVSAAHVNRVEAENYENHVAMAFEGFVVVVLFVLLLLITSLCLKLWVLS